MKRRAIFLDRDGTINFDYHYISNPDLVDLIPRSAAAIKLANQNNFFVGVITNQSGVNRGLITLEQLAAVHKKMDQKLNQENSKIDAYVFCVHTPAESCACRKPSPKMILDLAARESLDLANSFMVGDRLTDIASGKSAGTHAILVRTGDGQKEEQFLNLTREESDKLELPDFVADDLYQAVEWILKQTLK